VWPDWSNSVPHIECTDCPWKERSRSSTPPATSRVLVVGDVMLDVYLRGAAPRISPEAPVPVVRVEEEWRALGGAANVAANVVALGARCDLIGCIGA
jgi:bifunctional ADP-heptose synthase (sugar kinase/adenylyltransferase)